MEVTKNTQPRTEANLQSLRKRVTFGKTSFRHAPPLGEVVCDTVDSLRKMDDHCKINGIGSKKIVCLRTNASNDFLKVLREMQA